MGLFIQYEMVDTKLGHSLNLLDQLCNATIPPRVHNNATYLRLQEEYNSGQPKLTSCVPESKYAV